MADPDNAFTGSVPELYSRYMEPMLFAPYARDLARRIARRPGTDTLETACGTGALTRALRRALPEPATITATDLNPAMLDHARTLPGADRVRWQQANAQDLPFPDAAFDTVVCAFGVMFFPDKPRAYREALRVLRPGGRFLFAVWNELETMELQFIAHTAAAALYPRDPPQFLRRTPCGYHDQAAIRADLAGTGFAAPRIETLERTSQAASAAAAAIGFVRGTPLGGEITARDPAGLDRAEAAVRAAITDRFGAGPIRARMQAHVVIVRRAS